MKLSTMWNGNAIAQSPRKMSLSAALFQRFFVVYRTIIGVILHLFIICYDRWCHFLFSLKTFRHDGSAVFWWDASCPDINIFDAAILRQHWPFMSIKSFEQTQQVWRDMVSLCSLIRFNWRVPWPWPARGPLFSLGLKVLGSPWAHSRRLFNSLLPTWG